jgi:hypothetical protein
MGVQIRWKNGRAPLLLPPAKGAPLAPSGSPPPEPEPLPPGVIRVPAAPPPALPPKVAAFWFSEEADIPPWRRESDSERDRRRFLEKNGIWTG